MIGQGGQRAIASILGNMPLRKRFFIVPFVALGLIMIIGGIMATVFYHLVDHSRHIIENDFGYLDETVKFETMVAEQHLKMRRLLSAPATLLDVEDVYDQGMEALTTLDRGFRHLEQRIDAYANADGHGNDDHNRAALAFFQQIESSFTEYRYALKTTVEMTRVNINVVGQYIVLADEPFGNLMGEMASAISGFNRHTESHLSHLIEDAAFALVASIVLTFGLFLVVAVISYAIAKHLSDGMSAVLEGLKAAGKNEDPGTMTAARNDPELLPMVTAVETFGDTLRDLSVHREKLSELVDLRTTFLKEANTKLQLYYQALMNTDEAVIITDAKTRIIEVNDAFLKITGYGRDEILGTTPAGFSSGIHDEAFYQGMWQTLTAEGAWTGEVWDRRKSGEVFPKWLTINAVADQDGIVTNYIGIFTDISDMKATEARLENLAYRDPLTGLANRMLFNDRLGHALKTARRTDTHVAVMLLDLDRFKDVNDTLGHKAGDELLRLVSLRVFDCVRESDTLARLGGDEFIVILDGLESDMDAAKVAEKIIQSLLQPFKVNEHVVDIGASIGITIYPTDGEDEDALLQHADIAMYEAKRNRGGGFAFFNPAMADQSAERLGLTRRLNRAIKGQDFEAFYQPVVDIRSGALVSLEALVRWRDGETIVPPDSFIPFAEETGQIIDIEGLVLDQVGRDVADWAARGMDGFSVAVNISNRHFSKGDALILLVAKTLHAYPVLEGRLNIEMTETSLVQDPEDTRAVIGALKALGVGVALDDFGTGFSGMNHLVDFPIDAVKIDKSFVQTMIANSSRHTVCAAIINLGKELMLKTIAEGIETKAERAMLTTWGCTLGQGYLFSRPLPKAEIEKLLPQSLPDANCQPARPQVQAGE